MATFSSSKLIGLLKLLTLDEYNDLESWLDLMPKKAPKKVKSLYLILKTAFRDQTIDDVSKQVLFGQLYPQKTYHGNSINNLIREFTFRVESYLIHLETKEEETSKYLYFRSLLKRKESSFFFKEIKEYLAGLSAKVGYDHLFRMYQLLFSHPDYDDKYDQRSQYIAIQNECLENFFLEEKYTLLHELEAIGQKKNATQKQEELANLKTFKDKNQNKVVRLFEERFAREDPLTFAMYDRSFKNYLKFFDDLPFKFQRIFLLLSINDAVRLSVSGQKEIANQALFRLYSFGMQEKLLLTKSTVTPIMFHNWVILILGLDKITLLEEFLWKRALQLPSSWSKDAIAWANAKLAYYRGDYDKVFAIEKDVKIKHWLYKLQIRVVVLQAFYDFSAQENYRSDAVGSHFDTFRIYIQRNKDKFRFRPETYLNLIRFTKKIYQTRSEDSDVLEKKLDLIKKDIQATKALFARDWLLEKIKEKASSK